MRLNVVLTNRQCRTCRHRSSQYRSGLCRPKNPYHQNSRQKDLFFFCAVYPRFLDLLTVFSCQTKLYSPPLSGFFAIVFFEFKDVLFNRIVLFVTVAIPIRVGINSESIFEEACDTCSRHANGFIN